MYMYTAKINGRSIAYSELARFCVQTGRHKSAYRTKASFGAAGLEQAIMNYKMLNIGNGYKKRLVLLDKNMRAVLSRDKS